jgi:hypothetical protein
MDKRAQFFLVAAAASAAMAAVGLEQYRNLALGVAAVYVVLAVLSMLDRWSRNRVGRR